jgi:hypothetical protein
MLINAAWEAKAKKKAICRWFIAWTKLGSNEYAGAIAGYGGGGSFIVERFYAKEKGGTLASLWIDFTDVVTGKEIEFDECGAKALAAAEEGLDCIWEWNDNDAWSDNDEVILLADKRADLIANKDMLYLANNSASFLKTLCEKAGLIAAPSA